MKVSEAIEKLKEIDSDTPFDSEIVTGDDYMPCRAIKLYHEPPYTYLQFEDLSTDDELNEPLSDAFNEILEHDLAMRDVCEFIAKKCSVDTTIPSERELVEEVGYSRARIREALIRLECFGVIEVEKGKPRKLLVPL